MALLYLLRPSSFTCHWPRALTALHSSSSLSYGRPLRQFLQRCDFDRFCPYAVQASVSEAGSPADGFTLTQKYSSGLGLFLRKWLRPRECPSPGVPNPPRLRNTTTQLVVLFCTDRHVLARLLASLPYHGLGNSADMPDALGPRIFDRLLGPWTRSFWRLLWCFPWFLGTLDPTSLASRHLPPTMSSN